MSSLPAIYAQRGHPASSIAARCRPPPGIARKAGASDAEIGEVTAALDTPADPRPGRPPQFASVRVVRQGAATGEPRSARSGLSSSSLAGFT